MALCMVLDLLRLMSGVNSRGFLKVGVLHWKVSVLIICWMLDYAFEQHRNSWWWGVFSCSFSSVLSFPLWKMPAIRKRACFIGTDVVAKEKRLSSNCGSLSWNFSGAILHMQKEIKSEPFIKGWLQPSHVTWQF